jgi:hypothetical protein
VDYLFVPATPNPFSAKECRDANLLVSSFNKNMDDVRKYLVWVFKTGLGSNAKIVSLAYVNAPGLIRRYMLSADRKNTYTRNSPLPDEFLSWCKSCMPVLISSYTLETMNDLGALLGYVNSDTELQPSSPETLAINKAKELKLVVNGALNVETK